MSNHMMAESMCRACEQPYPYQKKGGDLCPNCSKLQARNARLLAKLPSDSLKQLAKTKDQIRFWHCLRDDNRRASACWYSRITGRNDPLALAVKNGELSQWDYNNVWLRVDIVQRLWELIQVAEQVIIKECKSQGIEYPFAKAGDYSACELFGEIVKTLDDDVFRGCLDPYREVSASCAGKVAAITRKAASGDDIKASEYSQFKSLTAQNRPNLWLDFVLVVCEKVKESNDLVGAKYADFCSATTRQTKTIEKAASQTRSTKKAPKLPSVAWKDGSLLRASRYGGVYRA